MPSEGALPIGGSPAGPPPTARARVPPACCGWAGAEGPGSACTRCSCGSRAVPGVRGVWQAEHTCGLPWGSGQVKPRPESPMGSSPGGTRTLT